MALYRLEAKIFSRENKGRSIIAASAYRNGSKLKDDLHEKTHDYTRRTKGVIASVILRPENSPEWTGNPGPLWNQVERGEKRKDAQLAREFILAVPPELSDKEQFLLACQWAQSELVNKGMIAEISLHHTKTGKNPHVHVLCTMRKLDGENFSSKKPREWNDKALLVAQRESWSLAVNAALERAGSDARVDHRSLKDQGIDRIPEPKIGVKAMAMKRRGVQSDPERFQLVRYVKSLNAVRPWVRAIEKFGEVHQHGAGETWWERSLILIAEARHAVRETVMDTWSKLVHSRHSVGHDNLTRGRDDEHSR